MEKISIKRKSPSGVATNNLILSATQGSNKDIFPSILNLYVPTNSLVIDLTYGKGVFWKNVDIQNYRLIKNDINKDRETNMHCDCRFIPFPNDYFDAVVFDPPYMHSPGGTAHSNHQNFEEYYQNNKTINEILKYHDAVSDLYFRTGSEVSRILKNKGIFIVKCQDEVCANKQRLTHVEIINDFATKKFEAEDIFVLVRNGKPGISRMLKQRHARKNHSYFLVFRKIAN